MKRGDVVRLAGQGAKITQGRDPSGDADVRDRTFARQAVRPCKTKTDDLVMKGEEMKERRLKKQQGRVKGLAL